MRSFVKYQFQLSLKLMGCLFLAQGTPKRGPDRVWKVSACSRCGSEGAGTVLLSDLSSWFPRNKDVHSPSGQRMLLGSMWKQTLKEAILFLTTNNRDLRKIPGASEMAQCFRQLVEVLWSQLWVRSGEEQKQLLLTVFPLIYVYELLVM